MNKKMSEVFTIGAFSLIFIVALFGSISDGGTCL